MFQEKSHRPPDQLRLRVVKTHLAQNLLASEERVDRVDVDGSSEMLGPFAKLVNVQGGP